MQNLYQCLRNSTTLSVKCRRGISESFAFRLLSLRTLRSGVLEESENSPEKEDLKCRIFKLRLPKRSATNVLQRWLSEGNQIDISQLRNISRELRRAQRYKHALEVWFMIFVRVFSLIFFNLIPTVV